MKSITRQLRARIVSIIQISIEILKTIDMFARKLKQSSVNKLMMRLIDNRQQQQRSRQLHMRQILEVELHICICCSERISIAVNTQTMIKLTYLRQFRLQISRLSHNAIQKDNGSSIRSTLPLAKTLIYRIQVVRK